MTNPSWAEQWRRRLLWLAAARSSTAAVAHTLSARLGVTLINFGTGIIIARSLAPFGRGEQAAMTLWPQLLCGLLTVGLPVALRYHVPRDPKRASQFLSAAVVYGLGLGLVAVALGVFLIPHWLSHYDSYSIRFAQWMMIFAPGTMIAYLLQAYLEGRGDFRQSNLTLYAPPATTLIALIALLVLHHMTPYTSGLAYAVPPTLLVLWRGVSLRASIKIPIVGFGEITRGLFSYGMKAYGIDVLSTLSLQIDQALVVRFLTAADLGVYTVSLALSRLLSIVASSLNVVLLPKAAGLESEAALRLVERGARLTFAVTAVAAAVMAILVPVALPILYGHEFARSTRIAQILFVEVTFSSTAFVLAQGFLSTGRPAIVTALQAVGFLATLPLMLLLVPRYGLIGAALALLFSTTLRMAFIIASYPILLKRIPPSLIITRDDIRFVAAKFRKVPAAEALR